MTASEATCALRAPHPDTTADTWHERLAPHAITKFFLRRDIYLKDFRNADVPVPHEVKQQHKAKVRALLDDNFYKYVIATRHGYSEDAEMHVLSYYVCVRDMRVRACDIPRFVRSWDQDTFWDLSAHYRQAGTLLPCVNCVVSGKDVRLMCPQRDEPDPLCYVAQHAPVEWELYEFIEPIPGVITDAVGEGHDMLCAWLRSGTPEASALGSTYMIPLVPGTKRPVCGHKDDQWTWARYDAYVRDQAPHHGNWGLLLDRVVAIDVDSDAAIEWLEEGTYASAGASGEREEVRTALASCPCERTAKGRHYLFVRPAWADEEGYYDGANQVDGLSVDVKSLCATGTRGVLAVAPSLGKSWMPGRAPWDASAVWRDVPRALLLAVARPKARKLQKAMHPDASASAAPPALRWPMKEAMPSARPLEAASRYPPVPLELASALLDLIHPRRFTAYGEWLSLGMMLHSNSDTPEFMDLWLRVGRARSTATEERHLADAQVCLSKWGSFNKDGGLGIGSLFYWAKEDDPEGYRRVKETHKHLMVPITPITPTDSTRTSILSVEDASDLARALHLECAYEWEFMRVEEGGKITPRNCALCLVDPTHSHAGESHHGCVHVNLCDAPPTARAVCYAHGSRELGAPVVELLVRRLCELGLIAAEPEVAAPFMSIELPAHVLRAHPEGVHLSWLDLAGKGDDGLSQLAADAVRDVVKRIRSSKSEYYVYNNKKALWEKGDERVTRIPISHAVQDQLCALLAWLTAACASEANGHAVKLLQRAKDALRSVIKYMRSYTGMRHVAEIAGELLYAEDGFEQRLDNFPHLLPVRNGVVDLRTGALRARTKEDMLYKVVNVEYDALADCTLIRQTVLEAMADDAEVADFLQLLLGYGITGDVSEEVFVVFTGSGRNCKGVITQQLMDVLGPYFEDMNPGIIVVDRKCNIDAERGKLLGKRLALFNELDAGEVLKTNEVKLLSGGDGIVARPVYRDPMTIIPRHLCVLCTNHMPRVSPVIPAMIERLLVIPFPVSFTNLEQGEAPTLLRRQVDPSLKGRLKQARPGTLRWLVDGAVRWYAVRASSASASLRRSAPAKVRAYSAEYLDGEDRLGVFIRTYCELGADHFVYTSDLLAHINEGVDIKERWGPHALSHAMDLKGFTKKVKAYDGRPRGNGYAGLRLMLDL